MNFKICSFTKKQKNSEAHYYLFIKMPDYSYLLALLNRKNHFSG